MSVRSSLLWIAAYAAFYGFVVYYILTHPDPHHGPGEVLPIVLIVWTGRSLFWATVVAQALRLLRKRKAIDWNLFHAVFLLAGVIPWLLG